MARDYRSAEHLPKRRRDGIPPPPEELPRQRRGTTPQMRGRYPDYDVLANADHWDEVTRRVVLARVNELPAVTFFNAREERTLREFCDLVMAQDSEPRIPVLEMVDAKLAARKLDGYRHHDMPEDPGTWRLVAAGLDEAAGGSFADLEPDAASALVKRFAAGELEGGVWDRLPPAKAWGVVMRGILSAFYSHPWAWNEIGYGGPAYPRGYMRLGVDRLEPHQRREVGEEDPVSAVRGARMRRAAGGSARGVSRRLRLAAHGSIGPRENDSRHLLDPHRRGLANLGRMARYGEGEEVDLLVIRAGAGGCTLAQRLARSGWRIVVLESGPLWDPDRDWVSDEAGSRDLYWNEPRVIGGEDPVELGKNNSGHGVGGSMVHYAGYAPRFHPSDFRTATRDGVGADWPISYEDLRAHYERVEAELPVSGQDWPWGDPHGYPYAPHPISAGAQRAVAGAQAAGVEVRVGPVAIANGAFGNRPHCIYRGFCLQGCKVNAKASPLITHLPDAIEHGVELRPGAHAVTIEIDSRGRASGALYHDGTGLRRQRAAAVAVACYSIETPRLLLNSASPRFPGGIGNGNDLVGRYLMVQGAPQVAGRFSEQLGMYKGPPPEISSEQFYETDRSRGFARGFSLQTVGPQPIAWAEHVLADGHWGQALREYMRDYNHWFTLGALSELLPRAENRVTLAEEKDARGVPVARMDYTQCDNDRANIAFAKATMHRIWEAAGAQDVLTIDRYAHLVGGARMGSSPESSVVDSAHRVWGIPNLLIADGSVMPTQGAANPALTIMALSSRLAALLAAKRMPAAAPCA